MCLIEATKECVAAAVGRGNKPLSCTREASKVGRATRSEDGIPHRLGEAGPPQHGPSAGAQPAPRGLGTDMRPNPLKSGVFARMTMTDARPSFCGGCGEEGLGRWGKRAHTEESGGRRWSEKPHPPTLFSSSWAQSQTSSDFSIT